MNRFDDLILRLPSGVNFYRLLEARPGADPASRRDPEPRAGARRATGAAARTARRADRRQRASSRRRASPSWSAISPRVERGRRGLSAAARPGAAAGQRDAASRSACRSSLARSRSDRGQPRAMRGSPRRRSGCSPTPRSPSSRRRTAGCRARELVILGLGRLGGGALTHASDLDLIYLFSGSHEAESDGPKPLRATDYFNRLAPRVTAALSVPTAAGPLYDVDTRLRPSGADGLLAISLESFAAYQREPGLDVRAYGADPGAAGLRLGGGPGGAGRRSSTRCCGCERDPGRRRRRRGRDAARDGPPQASRRARSTSSSAPGGLVDLEFAVHTLQLAAPDRARPRSSTWRSPSSVAAGLCRRRDRSGAIGC